MLYRSFGIHLKGSPSEHHFIEVFTKALEGHVAALPTLKANNWFDTLPMKQQEIMINNVVLLSSATNEETPYEQLLHY